ncbi:hypothetical protein M0R45_011580 [Rubus argutus]|uniref:Uncharacterized protein n=1 Tax=Rubus argutus TaxID=59490 RepID=A0AAW1YAK3_RUBAR
MIVESPNTPSPPASQPAPPITLGTQALGTPESRTHHRELNREATVPAQINHRSRQAPPLSLSRASSSDLQTSLLPWQPPQVTCNLFQHPTTIMVLQPRRRTKNPDPVYAGKSHRRTPFPLSLPLPASCSSPHHHRYNINLHRARALSPQLPLMPSSSHGYPSR